MAKVRTLLGWALLIMGITGITFWALSQSVEGFDLSLPQQQVTLDVTYSNVLAASFVAQELGLAADRVASVTVIPAGGCTVTFNLPLRTDLDQHFDRNGNVVTQRARAVNALDERQQARLDELMETQGCFRSRP